ncbi:MAG: nucleoside hydrolase [Pirellulales bacterium]
MPRKLIIDCDPGIDDAIALALALFDPRLEILAVTSCSGTVEAEKSTQNLQAIVELLDPPRHPRIGAGTDPEDAAIGDGRQLHGQDGLGNIELQPIGRQHVLTSEKLIADQLRSNPGDVTILCLGPLTGVARAFQRDPSLMKSVDRIVMSGGALDGIGDVTSIAEFNMHFDPTSAASVFRSPTTKTLVPLEVCRQLSFGLEIIDHLPPKYTRVGKLLHQVVPFFLRSHRQIRASESICLPAVIALLNVTEPTLFQTQEAFVEIEELGQMTRGATLVDRRGFGMHRRNMEVATVVDVDSARDSLLNALKFAGQASEGA